MIIVWTPLPVGVGGVGPPAKFLKTGWGWQDLSFSRRISFFVKRVVAFFLQFSHKKFKKKVYKQKCFSLSRLRIYTEGELVKKRRCCFWRDRLIPQCTLWWQKKICQFFLKCSLKDYVQRFFDEILQKHLLCISSQLLLYLYF